MSKKVMATILALGVIMSSSTFGKDLQVHADRSQNVITTFGASELDVYGVTTYNSRYSAIASKVRGPFAYMRLNLNFTRPSSNYVVTSTADACAMNRNSYTVCTHVSASTCNNSGPYHCSNAVFVSDTLFPKPRTGTDIEVFLTATELCIKNNNGSHGLIYGVAGDGVAIVQDCDAEKGEAGWGDSTNIYWVSKTMAHEIGHFWGAEDHYNIRYGDGRDNCIWGYNKDLPSVFQGLAYCADCYNTMFANINSN